MDRYQRNPVIDFVFSLRIWEPLMMESAIPGQIIIIFSYPFFGSLQLAVKFLLEDRIEDRYEKQRQEGRNG